MFLHLSLILFIGGGVYPSMQWTGRGVYPTVQLAGHVYPSMQWGVGVVDTPLV